MKNDQKTSKMPEIDFSTFIFSLNTSVLMHLGVISQPGSDKKNIDLLSAKQTIDIMSMIQEKTKGNLTEEEAKLLINLLHELRMRYVKACG
ncbi:MAG: DUF1844 domain-containing protein [Desulfobacterales bacterium]|nr:DUF1844 domain-containing protein [Desulfobacterales bacterium]